VIGTTSAFADSTGFFCKGPRGAVHIEAVYSRYHPAKDFTDFGGHRFWNREGSWIGDQYCFREIEWRSLVPREVSFCTSQETYAGAPHSRAWVNGVGYECERTYPRE